RLSCPSESKAEPQLELALLETRGLWKATRSRTERRWHRIHRISKSVDSDGRCDSLRLHCVEQVLELADDFCLHRAANRNKSRVAHIDVVPIRKIHRVAPDERRSIVVAESVAVQVAVPDDIERQAAVELKQQRDLVVVENRFERAVRDLHRRIENDAAVEIVADVHQV